MLGLKRNTVEVLDHNPEWLVKGQSLCQTLKSLCQEVVIDVQHIGSTAVPHLPAKPILDLIVGYNENSNFELLIKSFTSINLIYRGIDSNSNYPLFIQEREPSIRIAHIHCAPYNSEEWNNLIKLRDNLIKSPELVKEYANLKKELKEKYSQNRAKYTSFKSEFIEKALNFFP